MTIPLAINADSLATWVLDALAPLAGSVCFDIRREDQAHTSALLREGIAMAAITADAEPVPGCSSAPLGQHEVPLHGLAGVRAPVVRRWRQRGIVGGRARRRVRP